MDQSTLNVLGSKRMRRHAVRNAALSAALPMGFLAAVMTGTAYAGVDVPVTASDSAIMQPAGPRAGAAGKQNFNIEGDNNGANADYGILDFKGSDFGVPTATAVNSLVLTLFENNAGFTLPGGVEIYLASDSSANIQPGTFTVPTYQSGQTPAGIGSNTAAFGSLTDLGLLNFTTTGNPSGSNGTPDTFTLNSLPAAVSTYLTNQLDSGGTIRFVLTPNNPNAATVAATWYGATGTLTTGHPKLNLNVEFPPTGQRTLLFDGAAAGNSNFNTTDNNMRLQSDNSVTNFTNGDTVIFPNQPLGTSATFTQNVVVAAGGVQPAALNFTNTVGTYIVSGGPIGNTTFGFGRSGITVNGAGATVVLTSSNSFTGGVTINAGTLIIDNDNELGGSGSFATVSMSNGTLLAAADITSSRSINALATASINTNGHNVTFGGITGTAVSKSGAGSLITTGNVSLSSTLSVTAGNFVFAQPVVAGTGSFATVFNATTVNSTNVPTTGFNGNMVLSTPVTVRINGGTVSGTGSIFMDTSGALLSISGGSATVPLSAGISVPVVLNRNNAGGLNNGEGNPFTANFGANGGTSTGTGTFLTLSWRDTLAINGVISGNSDVNFGAAANGNSSDGVAGGDGIVLVNNSMTYTGATRITTGTFPNNGNSAYGQVSNSPSWGLVRLGVDNALPTATTLTWGKGAQNQQATIDAGALDLFGRSQTVTSIAVGQGVNNVGGIANFSNEATGTLLNATGTLIINGNASTSFSAPIGALTDGFDSTGAQRMGNDFIAIQLAPTNTGSLQLAHANTYIGGTTISGGTLSLGDPAALGFGSKLPINKVVGSTTVNAAGKLDLGGQTINEPITLNGGTLTSSGGATVNNGVKGVGFTATGSNIAGDATIAFSGTGSGANATPLLAVTKNSFALSNGGSGYSAVPRIQISGGNGTGALATALMGITNSSVTVGAGGTGYTSAPTITFNTPAGTGAVAATGHVTIDGSGHVTGVVIDTPGKGYTAAPVGTISGGGGTGATVLGTFTNLLVTDFNLTNGGTGFNSAPSITFINAPVSGTSATATSDNFHFTLVGIQQTDPGSGYSSGSATFASSGTLASGVVLTPVTIPTINLAGNSFIGGDSDIFLPVAMTGVGGFTKFGNATVELGGSNDFIGTTTVSAGTLKLSNANALQNSTANLTGSGSVVFNAGVVGPFTFGGLAGTHALALVDANSNPVILQVGNNNANTTYGGQLSGGGGITKIGTGTTTLTGANNYAGQTTVKAGRLELGTAAQSPVLTGNGADIQAGRIIFDYSGTSPASTISGLLTTSHNSNFTSGKFRSTTATSVFGLGMFDNGVSQVSVAYTYYGDANDDGKVNVLDFNALATNFGQSGKFWYQGDFNYSGNVDTLDFNALAANFNKAPIVTAPALGSLVPEPASIGLIAVAGMAIMRRRRRA